MHGSRHETPVTSLSNSYSNQTPKASSREDSRRIARVHFKQLSEFLETHLRKEAPSSRTSARDKLTRLTRQQFQELSTDVFDELCRRIQGDENGTPRSSDAGSLDKSATPFLPTKDEFHPKRNQARQKLATLPKTRFKDLASDVYYELVRRYPELLEEQQEEAAREAAQEENRVEEQLDMDTENAHSNDQSTEKRSSIQSSRKSANSLSNFNPFNGPFDGNQALMNHNQGTNGADLERNASLASTSSLPFTKATPRHSTVSVLQESNEQTELPLPPAIDHSRFGHDSLRVNSFDGADGTSSRSISYSSVGNSIAPERENSHHSFANTDSRQPSIADFDNSVEDFEPPQSTNPSLTIAPQHNNHNQQHKTASSSFFNDDSLNDFKESLENDMRNEPQRNFDSDFKQQDFGKRGSSHSSRSSSDSLRKQDSGEQSTQPLFYPPPRPAAAASSPLRTTFDNGEAERLRVDFSHKEMMYERERDELKHQVVKLIEQVKTLSDREDSRAAAEEHSRDYIHSLETQLKEVRDNFRVVKSELDRFKRSSGLQPPLPDNNAANISIDEHGAIAFETLTGLQTAIDDLVVAGRSTSPSLVLNVMKPIVGFVTSMQADIDAWQHHAGKSELNTRVGVLKERLMATLDNLMTATRNHAMGGGLSPISLLDAAASHVAMSAIEAAKLIGLRRSLSGSGDTEMVEDDDVERTWEDSKREVEEHSNKATAVIEHVLSSSRQHRDARVPDLNSYLNQIRSSTASIIHICQRVKHSDNIYRIDTIANNLSNSNQALFEYSGDEVLQGETRKKLLSTVISIASNLKDLMRV